MTSDSRRSYVYLPSRTVVVEDGIVSDLDGNQLGEVKRSDPPSPMTRHWIYQAVPSAQFVGQAAPIAGPYAAHPWTGLYATRDAAVAALLADPLTPTGGPNLFDRPA